MITSNSFFSILMLVAVATSVLFGNGHVIQGIIEPWADDGTYSHGYLILAIASYLFWKNREAFNDVANKINYLALGAFIAFYSAYSFGLIAGIEVIYRSVLPFILVSAFYLILNPRSAKKLVFPTLFVIFAIPFWTLLNPPLQYIAAIVVSAMVEAWGVSAYLDGIYITIGVGTFEVAGGCSGLRYLLVIMTLCSLFSHLYLKNKKSMAKIFALGLALSFVTNWIRILILVLLGHYTDMQHEMIEDHNNLGWVLFVVFLYPLYIYANKLADKELTENKGEDKKENYSSSASTSVSVLISLVVVSLVSINTLIKNELPDNAISKENLSNAFSEKWKKVDNKVIIKPELVGGEGQTFSFETTSGKNITATIHRYSNSSSDVELTDYRNRIYPEGWSIAESSKEEIETEIGKLQFQVIEIEKRRFNAIIFKINKVGNNYTTSNLKSKLLKLNALIERKKYSGTMIVSMECIRSCKDESEEIKRFINRNIIALDSFTL